MFQLLVSIVFHHQGSQLTVQLSENGHITITHLIKHRDDGSFTIGGIIRSLKRTDVRDITVVADGVVVDVVTHLLNQTVIAHSDIPQRGVIDTRMLEKALSHLHHLMEGTQSDVTIEYHTMEVVRLKILSHHHPLPVLCPADIILQYLNLSLC